MFANSLSKILYNNSHSKSSSNEMAQSLVNNNDTLQQDQGHIGFSARVGQYGPSHECQTSNVPESGLTGMSGKKKSFFGATQQGKNVQKFKSHKNSCS